MRINPRTRIAALLLGLVPWGLAATATAHDFWIEPSTFRTPGAELIFVRLKVGEGFDGQARRRNPQHLRSFEVTSGETTRDVQGEPGDEPAGFVLLPGPGLYLISYHSHPSFIELPADRFEKYLHEEGLEAISRLRAQRNQSETPGRESYVRCAKSLVLAGPAEAEGFDALLGLPLELVPERNPYQFSPGETLPVRLLFNGDPLADALVVGMNAAAPTETVSARTDDDGRVALQLDRPGVWMIKTLHMIEAEPDAQADWQSYWGSLTFRLNGTERPQTSNPIP